MQNRNKAETLPETPITLEMIWDSMGSFAAGVHKRLDRIEQTLELLMKERRELRAVPKGPTHNHD